MRTSPLQRLPKLALPVLTLLALAAASLFLLAACGGGESSDSNGGSLAQPERDSGTDDADERASSDRDDPLPFASVAPITPTPRPLPTRRFEVPPPTPVVLADETPPLHRAAFNGDLDTVKELLEEGEYADTVYDRGDWAYRTPLHAAVANDHVEIVDLLLEWDATVHYSHLSVAAVHNGDPSMVERLMEQWDEGADHEDLLYALGEAAEHSPNPEAVEAILDAMLLLAPDSGLYVDSVTRRGNKTALHRAAQGNPNPAVTQLLLERGADIQGYAEYGDYPRGWTPLHLAAQYNPEPAVAETLLQWAEDAQMLHRIVDAPRGCCEATPLFDAAWHRADPSWGLSRAEDDATGAAIAALLLDHGADVEAAARDGETPLYEAVRRHSHLTAAVLLDRGADINIKLGGPGGLSGLSLLHWTVGRLENPNDEEAVAAQLATIQLLLDRGLNIDDRESRGKTALLIALESYDLLTAEFLLEQGANPTFKDEDGTTPCSVAARFGRVRTEDGAALALAELFEGYCQ